MLVVKIELWPFGVEQHRVTLGIAKIANDRTGSQEVGNYVAELYREDLTARPWKRVTLKGFERKRSAWDLLHLVLKKVIGER